MFDIGFSELLVIGLVALIVIGPERLPRVARTLGILAGRLQRYVADVKADINREVELDELRKMKDSVTQAASSIENSVQSEFNSVKSELDTAESALNSAASVSNAATGGSAPAAADTPEAPRLPEKAA